MDKRDEIQKYINNFRRHLAPHLKPGIGVISIVYPARQPGAILEFKLGAEYANDDKFKDVQSSVNEALRGIPQRAFGGNLGGFHFSGTNYVMEDERIIVIKARMATRSGATRLHNGMYRVFSPLTRAAVRNEIGEYGRHSRGN